MNNTPIKYPSIEVKLVGTDGNSFAIIGAVAEALRKAKVPLSEIHDFQDECMSGDYSHLLITCMQWVNVT